MKNSRKKTKSNIVIYIIVLLFAIPTLLPFLLAIITSLKTQDEIVARGPLAIPQIWHYENYINIWKIGNFIGYYRNSIIVALMTVIGVLTLSLLGSYAFAYLKFHGKKLLFTLILIGLLLPVEMIIMPLFRIVKDMGLLNTFWSVILPQVAIIIPFGILLLRGFMRDIPVSLLESARLDGATEFQNLIYLITPLIRPAMVSLLIFSAMWSWNNFFLPTVMIQKDAIRTVPLGLNYFRTQYTMDFAMTSTAAMIAIVPIVIIYIIFQKKITEGMMVGAIKE